MKSKKCKHCKEIFEPRQPLQYVCSPKCAIEYTKEKDRLKKAKETQQFKREAKVKMLTQSDWSQILQRVFNQYIRLRDKDLPCISCGANEVDKVYDAGHYRSVGANPELRFNELNVNKQCRKCNGYWGGNLIEYRKGLIKKIGLEEVEKLETKTSPIKLSITDIQELIKHYKQQIKELKL